MLFRSVAKKEQLFLQYLQHPAIVTVQSAGCWISLQFSTDELNRKIVHQCVENGLLTDWFIFAPDRLRIAPPLCISEEQIKTCAETILKSISQVVG